MKKIWQVVIIVPIIIGIIVAILITLKNQVVLIEDRDKLENVFGKSMTKNAEITKFYVYGTSLNLEGKISGISKDNYEGIRIIITDGAKYNKEYKAEVTFDNNDIIFSSGNNMNKSINLDELTANTYYLQVRLKVNNSKSYKYYLLSNNSECKNIEYYTLTKNEKNNKVNIKFDTKQYNEKNYSYLGLTVEENVLLPENVYDFVIDAGHGGSDSGNKSGGHTEAELMLNYAKDLKAALESRGYKVKLTRDDSNTDSFTYTNMYDDNGRITIACESKAKRMISFHLNDDGTSGVQVYAPNNSDLELAKKIADNICVSSNLEYSSSNAYRKEEGVYVKNYRNDEIKVSANSMEKKGLEPYNITTNTPYLYTIREVGGIATNAYADGRNPDYSANKYYRTNQGIECYVVSIGHINKDIDTILNQRTEIVNAIANAF